jgi:hypothetical protein
MGDNSDCKVLEFPQSFANKRNIYIYISVQNNMHLRTMGDSTYQTIFSRIWKFSNTISLTKDIILVSSLIIKNTNCCLMSIKLKFRTSLSMNNLILSLFILNKLQSRRKCGLSSLLRQVFYSRSSLLSFLYLRLSISRACALILSLVRLFLLFSFFIVNM